MTVTSTELLALYRARLHATAVAEHVDPVDPNGDDARGIDPDDRHDHREDSP